MSVIGFDMASVAALFDQHSLHITPYFGVSILMSSAVNLSWHSSQAVAFFSS